MPVVVHAVNLRGVHAGRCRFGRERSSTASRIRFPPATRSSPICQGRQRVRRADAQPLGSVQQLRAASGAIRRSRACTAASCRSCCRRCARPEYRAVEKKRFLDVARMDAYTWADAHMKIFMANTMAMHRAGVKMAVGTDAGGPVGYNFQGYNTIREMELLVDAGLSPMEVIVAATRTGAELIGVADRLGTLAPGKLADLLMLEADPLADIRNVRRVRTVVLGGVAHRRSEFDARRADRRELTRLQITPHGRDALAWLRASTFHGAPRAVRRAIADLGVVIVHSEGCLSARRRTSLRARIQPALSLDWWWRRVARTGARAVVW